MLPSLEKKQGCPRRFTFSMYQGYSFIISFPFLPVFPSIGIPTRSYINLHSFCTSALFHIHDYFLESFCSFHNLYLNSFQANKDIHDQQASYAILYSLVILVEEKSLKSGQVIKRPSQNNMRGYSTHIYVSIMEKREDDT